jgi:hypothetical protein
MSAGKPISSPNECIDLTTEEDTPSAPPAVVEKRRPLPTTITKPFQPHKINPSAPPQQQQVAIPNRASTAAYAANMQMRATFQAELSRDSGMPFTAD